MYANIGLHTCCACRQFRAAKLPIHAQDCVHVRDRAESCTLPCTPFLFYTNHEAGNRPKIKSFVRITPGSRSQDL